MRKPIVAGNWKMNLNTKKSVLLAKDIKRYLTRSKFACDVLLIPSFPALSEVKNVIGKSKILLGAQDSFYQKKGAFTGEVSPVTLKQTGCKYVLVGHSERRIYFNETDKDCNQKIKALQSAKITPILCIGEKLEERQLKKTARVLSRQLRIALKGIDPNNIVIAYEPVWAISTFQKGRRKVSATPKDAIAAHVYIRKVLSKMFFKKTGKETRILYGGSVNKENALEFVKQREMLPQSPEIS